MADAIHEIFTNNFPINRLEERIISVIAEDKLASEKLYPLLPSLHALLLEECEQQVFASLQIQTMYQDVLRLALDHLQYEILQNLDLKNHEESFLRVMRDAGASALHIVSFLNSSTPLETAQRVYSNSGTNTDWHPGPKSWFPERGKSYVINLIGLDEERAGYFAIESGLVHPKVYETIRVRLSAAVKDMMNMRNIQNLNKNLLNEIHIREETENQLKDALSLVERISMIDELTGLYNRRGFFEMALKHIKFLKRHSVGFFLLYIDLDGLKTINDIYGHHDGDIAIQSTAEVLRSALRETDIVGRMGGDEFTAIISKVEPANYDCIYKRIEENRIRKNKELGKPWTLEMSIGYIYVTPDEEKELQDLLTLADSMLYKEKQEKKKAKK